jgi:DNA polymerase III subunit epsilon
MSVLEGPLVFVDIETNGLSYTNGRIIELAAIRVENGVIVGSINYLLNPGGRIPRFITNLTGITNNDILDAPSFDDIANELLEIMDGAVFVAHNVRFDYSFIKNELSRLGKKINPKLMCTVKLSRSMYPEAPNHRLQNLIDRCGLQVKNRHRAYDDADALRQFVDHLIANFPVELLNKAVAHQIKSPSLPRNLSPSLIKSLPEGVGVYIFEDRDGKPLYIGKSVNIKKRVLSHFNQDIASGSEFKISQGVSNIDVRATGGELEALLLESRLIKELQPLFNRRLRRNQKLTIARSCIDNNGYINISIKDTEMVDPDDTDNILSIYTTRGKARVFLNDLCKTYGFCPRLMGLEKGNGPCFASQLRKCSGACTNSCNKDEYNSLLLDLFEKLRISRWPYETPVLVQEINSNNEDYRSIVIDKWCVIADISQPDNCSPSVNFHSRIFDIDNYKIIKSFIDNKRHQLNIQPISSTKLQELAVPIF